jgi:hypothetical protein
MAIDSTIAIRRGTLILAKGNAALIAIVPAGEHLPADRQGRPRLALHPQSARRPLSRCAPHASTAANGRSRCTDSPRIGCSATQIVETAEDYAGRIGSALAAALDGKVITLTNGRARIRWTGSQLLMDPDEPAPSTPCRISWCARSRLDRLPPVATIPPLKTS